jgi:pimeloyl-ACP methyl ester carboxylesterase
VSPATLTPALGTGRFADVDGVRLHYVEAGAGPLVLLLHGFPQFWLAWRHQIGPLARAGFRVVAPDLRGYNLSGKPRGVQHYGIDALVGDVATLVRALGERRAAVVGHDWGGLIAWRMASRYPAVVTRVGIINAPHPRALAQELRNPGQLRRSSYVGFFQLPWLPETVLRARGFAAIDRVLRTEPTRPGAFTEEDIRRHKEALAHPGALKAALNYYRASVREGAKGAARDGEVVSQPTLVIWGDRDEHLEPQLADASAEWAPKARVEHLPDVSHWVMADAPERVSELLIDFLRDEAATGAQSA